MSTNKQDADKERREVFENDRKIREQQASTMHGFAQSEGNLRTLWDRRLACARRVFDAQKCFLPFNVKGQVLGQARDLEGDAGSRAGVRRSGQEEADAWRSANCFSHSLSLRI
jgi:hypothetical protein